MMVALLTSLIWLVHSFGMSRTENVCSLISLVNSFEHFQKKSISFAIVCLCIPDFIVGVCILYFVLLILTSAII